MLKIHEFYNAAGELSSVRLDVRAGTLTLVDEAGSLPLPGQALSSVMARYGAPFDAGACAVTCGSLELGDGSALRHVRHLAGYDVIARDYLVYEKHGQEPLCAMATTVAAALKHLGIAAQLQRNSAETELPS